MARIFRIANDGQTDTRDLLTGTVQLAGFGWTTSDEVDGVITEEITLVARGAPNTIAANIDSLVDILERAMLYHEDSARTDAYFLEVNADGESAKRALILGYSLYPMSQGVEDPLLRVNGMHYILTIDRVPFWETRTGLTPNNTANGISPFGYTYDPGFSGSWQLPARISFFSITANAATPSAVGLRGYIGLRPVYDGISSFTGRVNAELGSGINGMTTVAGGGDNFGTNVMRLNSSPNTTELTPYFSIKLSQISASNFAHFRGRYLIIGRFSITGSASPVVAIQMISGNIGAALENLNKKSEIVYLNTTGWSVQNWVELGIVEFPSVRTLTGASIGDNGWKIYAQAISGTVTAFHIDTFFLIPCDRMVKFYNGNIDEVGGDQRIAQLNTLPDDDQFGIHSDSGNWAPMQAEFTNWYFPDEIERAVVLCVPNSGSTINQLVNLNINVHPRWLVHRD